MFNSIIGQVPNYSFSADDEVAKKKLGELRIQLCKQLHEDIKSQRIVTQFEELSATKLYKKLQTLPKGCLHHVHFDCCEDQTFYAQHVANDPIIYLNKELKAFRLGSKQQAEKQGWISMAQARKKFTSEKQFIKYIANFTMLNKQELRQNFFLSSSKCWDRFENKIQGIFPILGALHLFKKYCVHILRKYVKNGYDRIQFRSLLTCLTEYNEAGQVVTVHKQKMFMDAFDEAFDIVKKEHPVLTVGFIFFGLKFLKPEQNEKILSTVLEQNWQKTIGIDFVQQQDPNGSQKPYDEVADRVLSKFPHVKNIKKVYHAGETKNHLNNNIQISINAGSARIGHGINVVQFPEMLDYCRKNKVCFEQCPISNMVLNYIKDPRAHPIQLLVGMGIPVTISPDDPARFGLEDSTMDFLVVYISSNWSLKHLKLISIYSINYAICSEEVRKELLVSFNKRWDEWVKAFITSE